MCGSVFLDDRFQDLVIQSAGKENWDGLTKEARQVALSRWQEQVKPHYEGPETIEEYQPVSYIPVPGAEDVPQNQIEGGIFYMEKYSSVSLKVFFCEFPIDKVAVPKFKKYSIPA